MLLEEPQVTLNVFEITNSNITKIGEINNFSSLQYTRRYIGYGTLELYVPLSQENIEYCKVGNMFVIDDKKYESYIITTIETQKDENGFVKIKVNGRSLEFLLTYRCIFQTLQYDNANISTILYSLVDDNFINPSEEKRKLPHLENAEDRHLGPKVKLQRTGKTVKERIDYICNEYDLGYNVYFDSINNKFVFEVVEHIDKTIGTNYNIVFDTDNNDIQQSTYMHDTVDEKNMGLVVGESQEDGEYKVRAKLKVGNDNLEGYARKEIYIDARDLQSDYENEYGVLEEMSEEEYMELLAERGAKKLSENVSIQSFEGEIRVFGSQFEYGIDYDVGDKVTFCDRDIGVIVNAYITQAEQVYTDSYELRLSIGYDRPTLFSKIRKMFQD